MDAASGIERQEANGVFQGVRIRVGFFDERERVLLFRNELPTAGDVCKVVAAKEGLSEESLPFFSLWIVGAELELQLKPSQDMFEMVKKWPRWVEKYTHNVRSISYKFVFKREAMVTKAEERKLKDEHAVNLLFGEARMNVFAGRYPTNKKDLISLAGIQMFIFYGDYRPEVHKPGFLINDLRQVMPEYQLYGIRPADLEIAILEEYARQSVKLSGKPQLIAKLLYLQYVRQWSFYGSTFFPACRNPPPSGYFENRGSDRLLVGVCAESVTIIDEEKHKVLISEPYDNIAWDNTPDSFTIEYGPQATPIVVRVITPQAALIASLVSRAIKNLDRADESMEQIRIAQQGSFGAAARPSSP